MFGWLKDSFKTFGKLAWKGLRRPETRMLVMAFYPQALLLSALNVVRIAENREMTGDEKKQWVLETIAEVAIKHGLKKQSDLNKLIEDALAIAERRAKMVEE